MNIKKQIHNLYIFEIISGFQIVDLIWVVLLLQRGFSMAEAGIAEGVFHAVSMIFEVPSGMISDTIGRRKTLMTSGLVSALASLCMIVTDWFPMILLSMGLNAVSYNLISGTREALTYDSLLQAGAETQYLKVSSRQEFIYHGLCAVAGIFSIVTISIGYRWAYILSVGKGILSMFLAGRLEEAEVKELNFSEKVTAMAMLKGIQVQFAKSWQFLKDHGTVSQRMWLSGIVSSGAYLVSMLLQEHLSEAGLEQRFIGIPLFLLSVFCMAGAVLGERSRKRTISGISLFSGTVAGIFMILSGASNLLLIVLAAGMASCFDEILLVRTENENQKEFSSDIRASMVSVNSMIYSISMAVMSPIAGILTKKYSISETLTILGIFVILIVWGITLAGGKRCGQNRK